jgi:hypothetical protein
LGEGVWLLYRTIFSKDETTHLTESAYLLENVGEGELANGRWAGRDELAMLTEAQRALVEEIWQERAMGNVPPQRPAWLRPGWFAEAAAWIETQLAARGETLLAPLELVKIWALSCVLKATTAQGIYYLKTVTDLPLFVNEASVVEALARLYPRHVPKPLVSDVARDWMLLPELPELVGWGGPVAQRQAFLADFGRLQVTAVADVDKLLAAG